MLRSSKQITTGILVPDVADRKTGSLAICALSKPFARPDLNNTKTIVTDVRVRVDEGAEVMGGVRDLHALIRRPCAFPIPPQASFRQPEACSEKSTKGTRMVDSLIHRSLSLQQGTVRRPGLI